MKKILLVISLIGFQQALLAQSDPMKPKYKGTLPDTTTQELKSKESDEDAIKLMRDQPENSEIIDTKDDQSIPPDTAKTSSPEEEARTDNGFTMRNGKVMSSENGTLRMLNKEMVLSNGIKVKPNGTVTTQDGSIFIMNEGQFIDMSGKLKLNKDSIQNRKL